MAGYTVANLKDVDNQGVHFGLDAKDLQVLMGRVPLDCTECGVSLLRFGPNFRTPVGHTQKVQEEIFVLVRGSARAKLDDDIVELTPLTAVRVAPETMRAFESGPDGADIIAIGAPNTGPGDSVLTPGWWTD
jgi:hypothetical protein